MNLFVTRIAPDAAGSGGAQRAMHLLRALLRHGPLDLVLLYREDDRDADAALTNAKPLVRRCAAVKIAEWGAPGHRWPRVSWRVGQVLEALAIHSVEAPRFSRKALREVGRHLPAESYDRLFAFRLSSATIADDLIRHGLLRPGRRMVDLDDRLSRFKQRELEAQGTSEGRLRSALQRRDVARLRRAEHRVVTRWNSVSVANSRDAPDLSLETSRPVRTVPNVVDAVRLPPVDPGGARILFVGHLGYKPNVEGLARFLLQIWPQIRARLPGAVLDVVGMYPDEDLARLVAAQGGRLHANVPSVRPYYADCDLVVAPIWSGGGTRIKIIEAMAHGRPVVSTSIGAEGLAIEAGRHALIADDPAGFADAVVRLVGDPGLGAALIKEALHLQRSSYSAAALQAQVDAMMGDAPSLDVAEPVSEREFTLSR